MSRSDLLILPDPVVSPAPKLGAQRISTGRTVPVVSLIFHPLRREAIPSPGGDVASPLSVGEDRISPQWPAARRST